MSEKVGHTDRPIPNDWRIASLKSVSLNGAQNGFFKKPELVGIGYKLVNVSELYQPFGIDTRIKSVERVDAMPADHSKYKVEEGDIFFTRSSLVLNGIAACNIVNQIWEPTLFECHVIKMAPDKSKVFPEFVAYCCRDSYSRSYLMSQAKQTTMTTISQPEIEQLPVPIPPLPEQHKIARILTTVDNLIEQTEALIEKYQSIKQGMMHDLFTRGVDATGQLRPPYEDAPQLYNESKLGWIPKEWEVAVLGEEIGPITSGWSPICDAETAAEGEWAILKTTAVVWDGYDDGENKRLPYHLQPLPKLEVVKDDVLITRKGPVERVGVVVHVPETRSHMMIPDTVFRIRIEKTSELSPAFIPLALGCEQVQTDWLGRKIGLADAQVNVNHGILRSTILPKPTPYEQAAICRRMQSIQGTIDAEQAHVNDLVSLKSGLMQDLLTGKVRVKVDEGEEIVADV